jgi:adenosyl cobinamide kinase/adenosyl cobinamide phosphate guanylyltransferase
MLIGIKGKARSGKDTFAELLANALFDEGRQRFVLMAYAHELKLRVQRDFDLF